MNENTYLLPILILISNQRWVLLMYGFLTCCTTIVVGFHIVILILVIRNNRTTRTMTNQERTSQNIVKSVACNCFLAILVAAPFFITIISASIYDYIQQEVLLYNTKIASVIATDRIFVLDCEKIRSYRNQAYTLTAIHVLSSICIGWCWLLYQPFTFLVILRTDPKIRHIFCSVGSVSSFRRVLCCKNQKTDRAVSRNNVPDSRVPEIELM